MDVAGCGRSLATIRRVVKTFATKSEPHNYYGELLLDQQKFAEAIEKFDQAIATECAKAPRVNVPPINKGIACFQWKNDLAGADALCNEALALDPESDVALTTLSQFCLQTNRLEEAPASFDRTIALATTEMELAGAVNNKLATQAQLEFMKNYPDMADKLKQLARPMA